MWLYAQRQVCLLLPSVLLPCFPPPWLLSCTSTMPPKKGGKTGAAKKAGKSAKPEAEPEANGTAPEKTNIEETHVEEATVEAAVSAEEPAAKDEEQPEPAPE